MTLPLTPEQVAMVVDALTHVAEQTLDNPVDVPDWIADRIEALETAAEYLRIAKIIQEAANNG